MSTLNVRNLNEHVKSRMDRAARIRQITYAELLKRYSELHTALMERDSAEIRGILRAHKLDQVVE